MRVRLKKINKMNSMIFNCPLKKNQAKKVKRKNRKDHRTRSTSRMRLNKVKRRINRKVKKSSQW